MVGFWCLKVSICLFGGCFFCKLESLYISECIQNVVVRPLAFRQMQYLCFTLKCLSITLTSKNQNTSKHFISPPQEILNRDLSPRSWLGIRDQKMEVGMRSIKGEMGIFVSQYFEKMWTWSYLILPFLHQHCPVDVNFTFAYVHFCPPSRVHATFFF